MPAAPVRMNNDGGSNPAFAGRVPQSSVQAQQQAAEDDGDEDDTPRPAAKQKNQKKQAKQQPKKQQTKQQQSDAPRGQNQANTLNSVAPIRPANGRFDAFTQ